MTFELPAQLLLFCAQVIHIFQMDLAKVVSVLAPFIQVIKPSSKCCHSLLEPNLYINIKPYLIVVSAFPLWPGFILSFGSILLELWFLSILQLFCCTDVINL